MYGNAIVAHVPRHFQALHDPTRRGTGAHGARRAGAVGLAVRLEAAAEMPALHSTLEALTLRGADHVDVVVDGEDHIHGHPLAKLRTVDAAAEFAQIAGPDVVAAGRLAHVAKPRLVQPSCVAETHLHRRVSVAFGILDRRHRTGSRLDNGHR